MTGKIFIIEDEPSIIQLVQHNLEKEGFVVSSSLNGNEGLKELKKFQPNILLLDWMLPDLSGIDVCKNAILTAKKNSNKFNLQNRLKFFNKSFTKMFNQKFDLIVSNPHYIMRKDLKNLSDDIKRYEPRIALDGGNDGLDLIKKVIYKSKYILKVKGTLALEIGNEQIKKVSKILVDNNFRIIEVIKDYKRNVRSVIACYK